VAIGQWGRILRLAVKDVKNEKPGYEPGVSICGTKRLRAENVDSAN